jgi:hypothetical protein
VLAQVLLYLDVRRELLKYKLRTLIRTSKQDVLKT